MYKENVNLLFFKELLLIKSTFLEFEFLVENNFEVWLKMLSNHECFWFNIYLNKKSGID